MSKQDEALTNFAEELSAKQKPLGTEFQKVLDDNLSELLIRDWNEMASNQDEVRERFEWALENVKQRMKTAEPYRLIWSAEFIVIDHFLKQQAAHEQAMHMEGRANLVSAAGDAGNNQETGLHQAQHSVGNDSPSAPQAMQGIIEEALQEGLLLADWKRKHAGNKQGMQDARRSKEKIEVALLHAQPKQAMQGVGEELTHTLANFRMLIENNKHSDDGAYIKVPAGRALLLAERAEQALLTPPQHAQGNELREAAREAYDCLGRDYWPDKRETWKRLGIALGIYPDLRANTAPQTTMQHDGLLQAIDKLLLSLKDTGVCIAERLEVVKFMGKLISRPMPNIQTTETTQ